MTSTKGSQNSIGSKKLFLAALPPVSYTTHALKELSLPHGLFDEKTSVDSPSPLDPLMPIIAAKSENDGPLTILDGCKRFMKMLDNKVERCACGVFDGTIDAISMGLIRIYLNQKRLLSVRESVCFFKWLRNNGEGADVEETMDLLGFNAGRRSELEPLLTCPEAVLNAINENRLSARLAADFCLMDQQDQTAFLDVFSGFGLSLQTQREFIEWLPEIAYAGKTTVTALVRSAEMQKIVNDKILNNPQKIEAVRALLHSWKFPLYDDAQNKWKKLAAATSRSVLESEPSSQVVFVPGPAFEMNKLEIRVTLNHAPAARAIFQKLSEIPQTTWSQLIYPINNFSI
jgi:hypothetical protein